MPRRPRGRGASVRSRVFQYNVDNQESESGDSVFGIPDPDNPFLCAWCQREASCVLAAPCGHQFCKHCVQEVVLPISACPFDKRFIRESRLAEFVFLETKNNADDTSEFDTVRHLESRLDSLTLVVSRLIEHLAVRNLLNEHRLTKLTGREWSEFSEPIHVNGVNKIPTIAGSDADDPPLPADVQKRTEIDKQSQASTASNLITLCGLTLDSGPDGISSTLITSDNVRELLPRFWMKATERNWSDEEKVQRLRLICDSALQRLLNNADLVRKDWSYISSLLYGDHVLDEVSMHRCLGSLRQKPCETPHQWYLRVCGLVERGLPPGAQRDWEIRSAFVRGLHPRYHQALGPGNLAPIAVLLERCSHLDAHLVSPGNPTGSSKNDRSCFLCGNRNHVLRDCPKQSVQPDDRRWTPWI